MHFLWSESHGFVDVVSLLKKREPKRPGYKQYEGQSFPSSISWTDWLNENPNSFAAASQSSLAVILNPVDPQPVPLVTSMQFIYRYRSRVYHTRSRKLARAKSKIPPILECSSQSMLRSLICKTNRSQWERTNWYWEPMIIGCQRKTDQRPTQTLAWTFQF